MIFCKYFYGSSGVINLNMLTIHHGLKLARFLHDIKVKQKGGINVKGKVTGFIHSGITVKDLEISLDFYVNKLGLELISRQISSNEYISDIVKQLPPIMERFYSSEELRTCKACGTVMEPPVKPKA